MGDNSVIGAFNDAIVIQIKRDAGNQTMLQSLFADQ